MIISKVGRGASINQIDDLDVGFLGIDVDLFVDLEAAIKRIHFGQRGDLSFFVYIMASHVRAITIIHDYPSFGCKELIILFHLLYAIVIFLYCWHFFDSEP